MKKLKMLFSVVAMLMLFSAGALFGCGDKYANMKLSTDLESNTVVLYLDQEEGEEDLSTKTFVISVNGANGDISKNIKQPYGAQNLARVTLNRQDKSNKTEVTLSAINYGEADMIFTTEEGGKTITIHVVVGCKLKSLEYNSAYKPYALVGETTKINTAKCLTFAPSQTTQKDVTYEMVSTHQGVELLPDGTIITSPDALNGSFKVKAISKADSSISTNEFDVSVIAGVEEFGAKYGETDLEVSDESLTFEEDALYFSSNMIEESYKIVEILALPEESHFSYSFAFVDLNGNKTSTEKNSVIASRIFECGMIDDTHIGITALSSGDELLEIKAYISGYEYLSKPYYIKLHSEQVAKTVTVTDVDNSQTFDKLTIYDEYNGGQGKAIKVEVGNVNAANKNFAVRIAEESVDSTEKISILTGKRDNAGNLIPAKLFTSADAEFDSFTSGTVLYVMAVKDNITGDATDIITVDFVAVGTMGLLGEEVYISVKFDLKIGVTEITLENENIFNELVYVPVKETINGEDLVASTQIILSTNENEYTYSLQTNSLNEGYYVKNEVLYKDAEVNTNHKREYVFEIYGIKEGVYTLNFFAQNGINIDIKIRVFTRVNELTITTNSVEQNSDIGQIEYKQTENELPTLEGGQIVLKLGGSANLNINAYYQKYLRRINFQSITYDFEDSSIVRIDSTNRIYGYNKGTTKVIAYIVAFDDADGAGLHTFELEFDVVVYIALQSTTLNTKNIVLYTKSTLGDYVDEDGVSDQEKYGEFTFVLKINPERTEINPATDINPVWSGNEKALFESTAVYEYNEANNTYSIKVSVDSLPITKETGSAKLTITVSQYGRIIIQDANIIIKNAKKVDRIYDVKKVQDRVSTNLTLLAESPSLYRDDTHYDFNYYMYFDARDIKDGGITFTLDQKIDPTDALNPKLIYEFEKIDDYDNLVTISNDQITVLGIGGLGYIHICAVDSCSYSLNENKYTYSKYVTILLKVADGLTKSTSLEVSSVGDLLKINTANGLDKFYIQTKNLNLSSQSNWTPIGYIGGQLYEFNGNYDGLLSSNLEDDGNATITGIKLVSYASDTKSHYGLFAKLGEDSVVENLNIDILNVNINTLAENLYVGAVAGEGLGEIRNVKANFINGGNNVSQNTNITAQNLLFGGIVGRNGDTTHLNSHILNVYSSGKINVLATTSNIGGLVGVNYAKIDGATTFFNQSQFNYSFNSDMYIVATNQDYVGGIVGITYAEVKNVSFAGTLIAHDMVGGIAGSTFASIQNAYSCGYIQANDKVGELVGYASKPSSQTEKIKILNSSANMFNQEDLLSTGIVAQNYVGGLVGYAEGLVLQNTYVRSYIKPDKDGFDGDIISQANNAKVGGLVGYAENVEIQKAYSILKISTADNAKVGGLVGYAENIEITNAFERNTATLTALAVAEESGTNSLQFFYSSNDGVFGISNAQDVKYSVSENTSIDYWNNWNITADSSEFNTKDWYIKPNETYPFIIFNDSNAKKLLTVEPPSSIDVDKKEDGSLKKYLYKIDGLADTFVLYRGKNSVLKFNNLFSVSVLPQDELLNIGAEYSISSSNSNVIQITGKTSMDYKLKINSTGKVVLKLTSKFSSDVSKEITIYVLNAVRDFEIKNYDGQNLLVGTQYELVTSVSKSYVNNDDYYIEYANSNVNLLINGECGTENGTYWHTNKEKVFITATKSGSSADFKIYYSLYTKLKIDNQYYNIPLINDNIGGVEEIQHRELSFNFIYGIKDFLCDTAILETGLNDYANIKYTLTGDDLRIVNNGYNLPKMDVKFTNYDDSGYWQLALVYVNVYFGDNDYVVISNNDLLYEDVVVGDRIVKIFHCQSTIDASLDSRIQNENNKIVKVEYLFEIKINSSAVQNEFKLKNNIEKFQSNLTATASIIDSGEVDYSSNTAQNAIRLVINRQKLDNISLNFYTNAEKTKDEHNNEIYTINEVPSNAIISGQTGMLKIALAPVNAEIKNVKVSYQSDGDYNLSMTQVLKHITLDEDGKEKVDYVVRKPYAIATDNGMALELYYNESNWFKADNIEHSADYTTYDGYLYVNCVISSSVPTNSLFYITVDVIYTNNYHLSSTIDLVSRLPSTISISYPFYNGQVLQDKAYLPINVEKEFYVDFVEIVDKENVLNIESMLDPKTIFKYDLDNLKIDFARNKDNSLKITEIGSGYRVYYTIESENLGKQEPLQAKVTKVSNAIQTTFQSDAITFVFVDFVVRGIKINDGGNNTNILTVPQSTTKKLDIQLDIDVKEELDEDGNNLYLQTHHINNDENDLTLEDNIKALTEQINTTMHCWYGRTNINQQVKYYPLNKDYDYENYYVFDKTNKISNPNPYIAVGVKYINTSAIIYNQIALEYDEHNYPVLKENRLSDYIGEKKLGLYVDNNDYIQFLQDDVTLNLISDVSSENSIPVKNVEDFLQMTNGKDGQMIYYRLTDDITLDDYLPMDLENISIDGNMHTITINNFKTSRQDSEGNIEYISNYGLFGKIGSNAIVKNLNINYNHISKISDVGDYDEKFVTDAEDFNVDTLYFGGVCALNSGIIYNVKVDGNKLTFTNNITRQNFIAGVCANNAGFISYTTSQLSFEANCGYIAGFVAINSKKISNSKVILYGGVTNTFTSEANSLTGGFVARNSGDIFGCYVSASSVTEDTYSGKIESRSTVGGFVNENKGNISSCYSNVEIVSTTRASGFVFNNEGDVENCYSSCKLLQNSNAHTPFIGTNELGTVNLNTGNIDDCYYIATNSQFTSITAEQAIATKVNIDDGDNSKKSSYAKFVFADKDKINGIWTYNYDGNTATGNPQLVDANLTIYSEQYCNGLKMEEDGTASYSWIFTEDSPEYGEIKDNKYNPRTITNIDEWNNVLGQKASTTQNLSTDAFVVLKDIVASRDEIPATSTLKFGGILLGNNMQISNLYLRVNKDVNVSKSFGLFSQISDTNPQDENIVVVKDFNLIARQVMASNAKNVGTLAGYINNAYITNINVDCSNVDAIQGRNMVGALAGIINNSTVTKIVANGNVNAGYLDKTFEFANYYVGGHEYDNDLEILTNDDYHTDTLYPSDAPYSYAGTFAGALVGDTTATLIDISGDNKVIGYYAGSIVGLVDTEAKLVLASTELVATQYVRAYAIAGGVVGENRGHIDRTYIEHQKQIQDLIDSDLNATRSYDVISETQLGTNRNFNFFKGSPYFIGGFVGFNNGGKITNSYSKLDVRTNTYSTLACGGFVGLDVGGSIENCYATGSVIGVYNIGGFIGAVTNKETLLGSTFEVVGGVPQQTPTRNNMDAINKNVSAPIFLSNYDYVKTNNKWKEEETTYADPETNASTTTIKRTAFIDGESKLYLNNNFASNRWLLGYKDEMDQTDAQHIKTATVGLFIGSIVDRQAKYTEGLDANAEANSEEANKYDYKNTTLSSVFDVRMLIIENEEPQLFNDNIHNYINTQEYKSNSSQIINKKNIDYSITPADTDKYILDAIIDSIEDGIVVGKYGEDDIDKAYENADKERIGIIKALEYKSIGGYKDSFWFTVKNDNNATNLCRCEANDTLITFVNIVKRDELLVDEYNGIFAEYDSKLFKLPKYSNKTANTSPIYPRIVCNINIFN